MTRRPRLLWSLRLAARRQGSWYRIALPVEGAGPGTMLYAVLLDADGVAISDNLYLTDRIPALRGRPGYAMLCFIPPEAAEFRLLAIGPEAGAVRPGPAVLRRIGRVRSALGLLRRVPAAEVVPALRAAARHPASLPRALRSLLATANRAAHTAPQDYATWIMMFDRWAPGDLPPAAPRAIGYLVLAQRPGTPALAATLASIAAQQDGAAPLVLLAAGQPVAEAAAALGTRYVGILQAGEVLPAHATRLAAAQLRQLGHPGIAIVDEDGLADDRTRHAPCFKPTPGHVAMLSGLLARGLWLVEAGLLPNGPGAGWAEALRLDLWLARYRAAPRAASARIPFILTHRRADAEAAPPALLADIVARHLAVCGPAIAPVLPAPALPLTFRLRDDGTAPGSVTAIVPSTLRQPHSLACIKAILAGTDHPAFRAHVAVMQPGPLDATQQAAAAALARHPNASVSLLPAPRFNFSTVNNHVAAATQGDFVLLLNDDVSPIRADWLRWMLAFMADPRVGLVGARLLYPDNTVQHGGVIMGLSGLCDHAHRNRPAADPGPMHRAAIAQEMSAVTAACMLVRRGLFEQVGGLDPLYPSAFNDVDFALRIGETGHSVVYAAQAELHHHELQTYGSHYAGERQSFQDAEVARMRQRWADVSADDPFHNPNLSLVSGQEWRLAFPPRVAEEKVRGMNSPKPPSSF